MVIRVHCIPSNVRVSLPPEILLFAKPLSSPMRVYLQLSERMINKYAYGGYASSPEIRLTNTRYKWSDSILFAIVRLVLPLESVMTLSIHSKGLNEAKAEFCEPKKFKIPPQ